MRWLIPILALAGCSESDFDTRYHDTEKRIKAQEVAIDKSAHQASQREAGDQTDSSQ
jgi:hypothetical protein